MGLRDIESTLPPGFRFYPSDQELVCHYLQRKVTNHKTSDQEPTMVEVDLHTREPWELPEVAKLCENEWYFFSFRDRKYATGLRTNRATKSGYWKATGKDRVIHNPKTHGVIIGMRKTLVFYRGRAPNGMKTSWVMHEFRLENPHSPPKEDWVLCRVFHKRKVENVRVGFENIEAQDSATVGYSDSNLEASGSADHDQLEQLGNIETEGCHGNMIMSEIPFATHQEGSKSNSFLNLALLQHNFLDFQQEIIVDSTDHLIGDMGSSSCRHGGNIGDNLELSFLVDMGLGGGHDDHDHQIGDHERIIRREMGCIENMRCQDGKEKYWSPSSPYLLQSEYSK